jgi:hypothetical protein
LPSPPDQRFVSAEDRLPDPERHSLTLLIVLANIIQPLIDIFGPCSWVAGVASGR